MEQQMCAQKAADWIISGTFQKIEGVSTVEPASTLKGKPPLLSYKDGKFYLWKSCWSLTESAGSEVRVYGLKDRGVFYSEPLARPVPGQPQKKPLHQYCC
jgi:hypothetical protein